VNLREFLEVQREGRRTAEDREIEFLLREHPELDRLGVGAQFGRGEHIEERIPRFLARAENVLNRAQGAIGALGELLREGFARRMKRRIEDLPERGLLAEGRR